MVEFVLDRPLFLFHLTQCRMVFCTEVELGNCS